ncbi:oleoyl phosphatidylcholine desaturase [Mycena albidolilacea]|uniref:Oleoyl phosphatidylcholine desaturase n=1 Tax=Mycena albidolilacea TaxID=1033008 RepID=A0AAD7EA42_9AGAR|nr:oleoyl phosphatidylcholine desaturase [Mycena albidolilacea]
MWSRRQFSMSPSDKKHHTRSVEQVEVIVPNLSIKDLLSAIPFSLWSLYGFFVGPFGMGLWVVAHEAGELFCAFSTSRNIDNCVGWILHSRLDSSHVLFNAATGHMTRDQVFVPWTRSQMGLPSLDKARDDILGSKVSAAVQDEIWEAIGESPILAGLPVYLLFNIGGQSRYPKGTNHHALRLGIFIWLAVIILSCGYYSFATVFRAYLVPYIWVNHWLVLITFLHHSDPLVPHYRTEAFTFPRGALCTMDRSLLGRLGPIIGWLGAHATHGISETHVLHHVSSRIAHYHAWEATYALRKRPGGWGEVYRVVRECRFMENEGAVVFYKNCNGLAAAKPASQDTAGDAEDSGVESKEY